jgi:hypothetical protein
VFEIKALILWNTGSAAIGERSDAVLRTAMAGTTLKMLDVLTAIFGPRQTKNPELLDAIRGAALYFS